MIATNHALTGAIIGLSVTNPILAIPLALISHFVLDALPHFGYKGRDTSTMRFKLYLLLEAFACFLIVLFLALSAPAHWVLAAICAFTATSPDFMSIPYFLDAHRGVERKPKLWFMRFAKWVQWGERRWGWTVELAYFVFALTIFVKLVTR